MSRLRALLARVLPSDGDLTTRTVVGGLWVAFTNGGNRVLELLMLDRKSVV